MTIRSGFFVMASAIAGCSPSSTDAVGSTDDAIASTTYESLCSEPVASNDGAYLVLDFCPTPTSPGRIVRLTIATGAQTLVETYLAADRLTRLGARGGRFYYGVGHSVGPTGVAAAGTTVIVHDWTLASSRTIATAYHGLGALEGTEDGKHLAYAALADYPGDPASAILHVAETIGAAPIVDLDPGASSLWVEWEVSGANLLGKSGQPSGLTTRLVSTAGAAGPSVSTPIKYVDADVFVGRPFGDEPPSTFDGTSFMIVRGATFIGPFSLIVVDAATGGETTIDTAEEITLGAPIGSDIVYARTTSLAGSFTRTLVKRPRTGGGVAITLVTETAPTKVALKRLDIVASDPTGTWAIVREGDDYLVVRLDGTAAATPMPAGLDFVEAYGATALFMAWTVSGVHVIAEWTVVDLSTGTFGISKMGDPFEAHIAGDGSLVARSSCTTATGAAGALPRRATTAGETVGPCSTAFGIGSPQFRRIPSSGAALWSESVGTTTPLRYRAHLVKP